MRIDHHAYQRATRIAGVGFLVQLALGLTLLVFALATSADDTAFLYGGLYILLGLLPWIGLLGLFTQQKLERLEALEHDEVAGATGGAGSAFDGAPDESRVAARRLAKLHQWVLPAFSLFLAGALAGTAWLMLRHLGRIAAGEAEFHHTALVGWAVAICLAFTAAAFIVSRFVAGMAKLDAWQNLRGGAAYMVGNSLVTLAIAVGIGFRFFENDQVAEGVAYAIPFMMLVQAAEIILNFVLHLYRPRIPGETPRPAFDSKLLSMLAAPDNLVRSINEAVNYQFGFDITSSWGYQLFMRSVAWLVGGGVAAVLLLNMVVIVEPQQQAVKLAGGRLVSEAPHDSGILWKLPWPLQTAEVHDVAKVRSLHLTSRRVRDDDVHLWADDLGHEYDKPLDPFIVGASRLDESPRAGAAAEALRAAGEPGVSRTVSLVDCEIAIQYCIRADGGLIDWLRFASDETPRRQDRSIRESALRAVALREATQHLATLSVDDVLASRRSELGPELARRVQAAFDAAGAGVEVVAANYLMIRPAAEAAAAFEEFSVAVETGRKQITEAEQRRAMGFTERLGDAGRAPTVLAAIAEVDAIGRELGPNDPEARLKRVELEGMLVDGGGGAGLSIIEAERDGWVDVMRSRAQAMRIRGQVLPFRAAPELYKQRELMRVYRTMLPRMTVTVMGIPFDRVDIDMEMKDLDPLLQISDALNSDTGSGN